MTSPQPDPSNPSPSWGEFWSANRVWLLHAAVWFAFAAIGAVLQHQFGIAVPLLGPPPAP